MDLSSILNELPVSIGSLTSPPYEAQVSYPSRSSSFRSRSTSSSSESLSVVDDDETDNTRKHTRLPALALDRTSSSDREYACVSCGKGFARRSDRARHERIHSGVKPHACEFCDKSFIQRSALKVHARIHTGEKPHACEECKKAFSDSSSLSRHRRTHTGKRPYVCPAQDCGKSFTRKTTLTRHMNHHPGPSLLSRVPSSGMPNTPLIYQHERFVPQYTSTMNSNPVSNYDRTYMHSNAYTEQDLKYKRQEVNSLPTYTTQTASTPSRQTCQGDQLPTPQQTPLLPSFKEISSTCDSPYTLHDVSPSIMINTVSKVNVNAIPPPLFAKPRRPSEQRTLSRSTHLTNSGHIGLGISLPYRPDSPRFN